MFKTLIVILMTSVLVNNYVLNRFLGICPFLGVSKKLNQAVGMGVAVIFVMLLATLVTWPIQRFLLEPNDLGYMQTIIFILVIAALVQLVEIILKRYIPSLHGYNFLESMVSSLGCGLGFLLAMVLFAGVRSRLETSNAPQSFKGLPITLIAAAIVSCAFFGFAGIIENLFM